MSNAKLRSCPICGCEEKITAEIPTKRGRMQVADLSEHHIVLRHKTGGKVNVCNEV